MKFDSQETRRILLSWHWYIDRQLFHFANAQCTHFTESDKQTDKQKDHSKSLL